MKKFFAAILTAALALSLSAPAFAAGGQFLVNGEPVFTIPAGAAPEDYLTVDVADLVDASLDPAYIETSLGSDEYTVFYPDGLPTWQDDIPPLTLVVNGMPVEDSGIYAEYGVSYAAAGILNAAIGTNYSDTGSAVSIRKAAEDAGWDVGWNQGSNTVFLLDREGLKAQYAESMAALDAILDWALEHTDMEPGQSYRTTETVDMTLTMLDSLDGDKDYKLRVTVDALLRDGVVETKVTANAADLLALLGDDLVSAITAELPKPTLRDLKTLLAGVECSVIMDLEKGNFYCNLPILAAFTDEVQENTWFSLSAGAEVDETLAAVTGKTPAELLENMPALLAEAAYQSLLTDSADRWNTPQDAFAEAANSMAYLNVMMGPDTLKKSGATLTWSVDAKTVNTAFSQMLGINAALFKAYDVKCVMKKDGSFTCDMAVRPDMEGLTAAMYSVDSYYNSNLVSILSGRLMSLFDFQTKSSSSGSADKATGSVEYHLKNIFKLKMDTETVRRAVKDVPAALPPAGAPVIELP